MTDEELATQIAKDLACCVSSESRYQVAREIIRTVRADERRQCASLLEELTNAVADNLHPEVESALRLAIGTIRSRSTP